MWLAQQVFCFQVFFLSVSCLNVAFGETHQPEMLSRKILYCLQVQIIDKNLSFKLRDEDSWGHPHNRRNIHHRRATFCSGWSLIDPILGHVSENQRTAYLSVGRSCRIAKPTCSLILQLSVTELGRGGGHLPYHLLPLRIFFLELKGCM